MPERQIVVGSRRAHPGDVEIGPVEVAAEGREQRLDQLLRLGMVDELRLQLRQQRREILDRHVVLRGLRILRAERLGDEVAGVLDERERLR